MMTVIYIYNAYINIYKGLYYCIKIQKDKNKMAAVCLWLIENKSLQMYSVVSAEFVFLLLIQTYYMMPSVLQCTVYAAARL